MARAGADRPRSGASTRAAVSATLGGFGPAERRYLLQQPGIAEGSVQWLERAGYSGLDELRSQGFDALATRLLPLVGPLCWRRRRQAFHRLLNGLPPP
jgi:hypothetical protein